MLSLSYGESKMPTKKLEKSKAWTKPKFEPELEEYLNCKKTKSTRNSYATGFRYFLEFYQGKYGSDRNLGDFLNSIFEEFKKPIREQKRVAEIEIKDFIKFLQEKNTANNSIRVYFAAIQNFLKYKQVTVSMEFVGVPSAVEQQINGKHEWSIEQIKQFVDKAPSYREKAIIICTFQSGLGVNETANLNYGDVQEELEKNILPLCLKLVRQKTQVQFKTFFGRDAVHYLKLYLATRKDLKPDSPLFIKERIRGGEERITAGAIEQSFSEISKDLDFIKQNGGFNPARPHSLRAAFNSQLIGKIDQELREFWMGHSIGVKNRAYLCLPTSELRTLYSSAEEFLKIEKSSKEELTGVNGNGKASKAIEELQAQFTDIIAKYEKDKEKLEQKIAHANTDQQIIKDELTSLKKCIEKLQESFEKDTKS